MVLLVLLTTLPVLVEALVLRLVGFTSVLGLAAQITAPSPFGMFHDLRWVQVYHDSWWAFAWESVAAIVMRSLLTAGVVSLAWTGGAPQRSWLYVARMNLAFNALVYVVLSPWAAVAVAASDTSLFWFLLGELAPLVFLSLVLQRGGIVADWWRHMPSLHEAGWALASFVVLTLDAMAIYSTPGWWAVPVAAAAGTVNAVLWRGLVCAAIEARPNRWIVPAGPLAVAISAGALLAMGQFSTIGGAIAQTAPAHVDLLAEGGVRQLVVYVAGYDSALDDAATTAHHNGPSVVHYSYRGLDQDGGPLPYGPSATHQSLSTSAALLAEQVETAHRRTGRDIALVAQSEGTLVVRTYLADFPHQAVDAVVLLSPLVQPGRVYFPQPQAGSGWGIATGWLLRGMFAVVRATSHSRVSPDEPFVRSVLDQAPAYRGQVLCPVPGVRVIAFVPFTEAAVSPPDQFGGVPVIELPGLHAGLLGEPDVQRRIIAFLRGRSPDSQPGPGYAVIQRAAGAWQAPALALGVNPSWHATSQQDPTFGQPPCR
jgi:hypothetical protein